MKQLSHVGLEISRQTKDTYWYRYNYRTDEAPNNDWEKVENKDVSVTGWATSYQDAFDKFSQEIEKLYGERKNP